MFPGRTGCSRVSGQANGTLWLTQLPTEERRGSCTAPQPAFPLMPHCVSYKSDSGWARCPSEPEQGQVHGVPQGMAGREQSEHPRPPGSPTAWRMAHPESCVPREGSVGRPLTQTPVTVETRDPSKTNWIFKLCATSLWKLGTLEH